MKTTGTKEKAPTQLTLKKVHSINRTEYPPTYNYHNLLIDTSWSQCSSQLPKLQQQLQPHSIRLSGRITICYSYSLFYQLYYTQDSTCILWDLSKLIFLRQLQCPDGPITAICINDLTVCYSLHCNSCVNHKFLSQGDIATCAKQYLYMWNVNGHLLASTRVSSSSHVSINCCIMSEV